MFSNISQRWSTCIRLIGFIFVIAFLLLADLSQFQRQVTNNAMVDENGRAYIRNDTGQNVMYIPYMPETLPLCKPNVTVQDLIDPMKLETPQFIKKFKNPCWHDNQKLRCLPYVYLVGVAKCGTTDLFKRLTLHPDFVAPVRKEPNWLSEGRFSINSNLSYYTTKFFSPLSRTLSASHKTGLITGEASINTLEGAHFWKYLGKNLGHNEPVENNAEYIHHLNNESRILINVRNPVDRLWSEYLAFSKSKVKSPLIFHQMVERQIRMYKECMETKSLRSCLYDNELGDFASRSLEEQNIFMQNCQRKKPLDIVKIRRGIYHVYIKDFLKVFPEEQILVQRLEDISTDLRGTLARTFKFLGLRNLAKDNFKRILDMNVRNQRRKYNRKAGDMWTSTREMLYEFYRPHNEALALLLNDNIFKYGPQGSG